MFTRLVPYRSLRLPICTTWATVKRPRPKATVSTPVTWSELERGVSIDDFRIDNVPARLRKTGDLWKPLLAKRGRFKLEVYL